jgi:hypothetical protein
LCNWVKAQLHKISDHHLREGSTKDQSGSPTRGEPSKVSREGQQMGIKNQD